MSKLLSELAEFSTLVDVLRWRAAHQPDDTAYIFLEDGETQETRRTYGQLDRQARVIAETLKEHGDPGQLALLLYVPGIPYIEAYMGCLYAGWAPIPAYPPDPARLERMLPRILSILDDASPAVMLTTGAIKTMAEGVLAKAGAATAAPMLVTDDLQAQANNWTRPDIGPDTVALVQYTSGSTANPKGVLVTHGNLMHNFKIGLEVIEVPPRAGVSWLPPYHDMGLIAGILHPLHAGYPMTLMSPFHFLRKPVRWLHALTKYKANLTLAPNFAYSLTLRRLKDEDRDKIDLSSLENVFNAAEMVRADVIDHFCDALGPRGLKPGIFIACYGLAESTLVVSGGRYKPERVRNLSKNALAHDQVKTAATDEDRVAIVSCGTSLADGVIRIVNPDTGKAVPDGTVGEVWVQSPSVAKGYLNRSEESEETFGARLDGEDGTFLRTGDLGFLEADEIYIVGRIKDLIIQQGRNLYPTEIEVSAERSHGSLRWGCSAAFAVDIDGTEKLVIVCEVDEGRPRSSELPASAEPEPLDIDEIFGTVTAAIAREHEATLSGLVLVKRGMVFKTPSGKVQRRATRKAYLEGKLDLVGVRQR